MAQVIKIKYENALRRIALQQSNSDAEFTFVQLDSRIRQLFQIPNTAELTVTYIDKENDVVTMGNDHDLKDALVYQSINPLRLFVTLGKPTSTPGTSSPSSQKNSAAAIDSADAKLKQLLKDLTATPASMKLLIQSYETLFKRATTPAQMRGLLENVVQTITSQLASAAKDGARAATPELLERPENLTHETSESSNIPSAATSGSSRASGAAAMPPRKDEGPDSVKAVHHGVTCDVCGVNPIMGNRWNSNLKHDYDLCPACFEKHGNEVEYTRIAQPALRPRHFHGPHRRLPVMSPTFTQMGPFFRGGRPFGMWSPLRGGRQQCSQWMGHCVDIGGKLDARFVCDITMFDGTEVAPGTSFTKIWRLRNSGSLPWPAQTSLLHVGGDYLGHVSREALHIPEQGLAPEAEIEVSVDLVAPEKPGRYVSHWRLASPSGPKFGHRFWVHIQVVPKEILDQPVNISDDAFRQNPEAVTDSTTQVATKHFEPAATSSSVEIPIRNDGDCPQAQDRTATEDGPVVTSEVEAKGKSIVDVEEQELDAQVFTFSAEDLVDPESSINITEPAAQDRTATEDGPVVTSEVEAKGKSIVDVEEKEPDAQVFTFSAEDFVDPESSINITEPAAIVEEKLSTAKAMLDKLEAMGFVDDKLNAALLEKNGWDLRSTLDDLCAAEEWDPIMGELEEMGFYDTETNRRLMFKNKGSVKHVVKELVQMSKGVKENIVDE